MSVNAYKLLNIAAREEGNNTYLKMYRGMCIAGSIIYPLFYILYSATETGYPTGISVPLFNSGLCLLVLFLSYYSEYLRRHIEQVAHTLFYTFTLHGLYNLHATSFGAAFFVDFLVVITVFSVATNDKVLLTAYTLFTFLGFCFVNFSSNELSDALMYQSNVGVIFLIFHIVLSYKIELKNMLGYKADLMYKLFSKSPDAILFIDPKRGEIVNCNDMAVQLFGYHTKDELRDMSFGRFFADGETPAALTRALPQILKGQVLVHEEVLHTRNGQTFWGNMALSDFAIGTRSFVVVRVSDIDRVKRANEALRRSEEQYRDIVESSHNLICLHTLDGVIQTANPAFVRVLGFSIEELIGKNISHYLDKVHAGDYERYVDELLTNGSSRGIMSVQDKWKNIKYLEYNNTLKTDANGEIMVHGMATDITEKHLMQLQMMRSEKRYRLISENSHDLVCQHLPNGRYDYVSHSVVMMLGYTSGDLIGIDPMELVHGEDRKLYKLLSPFYTEQIDSEPVMVEYRLVHKSGRAVWVNTIFKPVHNRKGILEYYHSASRDISERKRGEVLQERKDRLFKALTESSAALLSHENFEQAMNIALKTLGLGLDADRLVFYEQQPGENGKNISNHLYEWRKEGNEFVKGVAEMQCLKIDELLPHWYPALTNGLVIKGLTSDFPFPDRMLAEKRNVKSMMLIPLRVNGELYALLGVIHTHQKHVWSAVEESVMKTAADGIARTMERVRNERELKKAKEAAEAASLAKETFLASVSHEVRTPMNGILGLTHLMMKSPMNETQRQYIQAMRQSGEFMLSIINDLLDFSKIVAGHMEFENIPFDLKNLLFNIQQTYGSRAAEKGIKLVINTDEHLPRMYKGDPTRLNQILVNLLGNSIKFTEQGKVELNISLVAQSENKIRLKFEVNDTGIGISKDKQESIFECFKQAESDTSRKYGGTGLGLSIVKRLIEAQNSTITLQSEPGCGSTFYFELDFETTNTTHESLSEPFQEFINLSGVNILLAEDNTVNQLLAKDLITGWGATLDIVENGEQAIEYLIQNKYDLVLMDVQMPVMNGLEATEIIRHQVDSEFKNIPVIAMTADAVKQNIEKCFESGITDHITKPFDAQQLNSLIWRHVPENRKNKLTNVNVNSSATPPIVEQETTTYTYISLKNLLDFSRGKNDFVVKMLRLLLEQTPPAVQSIGEGVNTGDWDNVRALAHKMKPNINLMGNTELDRLILTIEKDADSRTSVETIPQVYADFKQLYDCAINELRAAYTSYNGGNKSA